MCDKLMDSSAIKEKETETDPALHELNRKVKHDEIESSSKRRRK